MPSTGAKDSFNSCSLLFSSPAEPRSCSKPNTALEDPRSTLKFQYFGLDAQPQPKTLRDRSKASRAHRDQTQLPAHLRAGENNVFLLALAPCLECPITSSGIDFILFQRYRKRSSIPGWRCIHCTDTLSWKEQFLGFIFHKIRSQCYKQVLLTLHDQHISNSTRGFQKKNQKTPSWLSPQETTPCPRTQILEEKLPSSAASLSNSCEWREPGSQGQELELSTAFYFTIYFNLLKYTYFRAKALVLGHILGGRAVLVSVLKFLCSPFSCSFLSTDRAAIPTSTSASPVLCAEILFSFQLHNPRHFPEKPQGFSNTLAPSPSTLRAGVSCLSFQQSSGSELRAH